MHDLCLQVWTADNDPIIDSSFLRKWISLNVVEKMLGQGGSCSQNIEDKSMFFGVDSM